MKSRILICMSIVLLHTILCAQDWQQLAETPGTKFDDVVTAFEKKYNANPQWKKEREYDADGNVIAKENPEIKFFKRWYAQNRNNLNPDGSITDPSYMSMLAEIEYFGYGGGDGRSSIFGEWESLGPQSVFVTDGFHERGIGRVNCITFDIDGTMYVGSASGGAWRKNPGDANSGYTSLTNHIPNLSVSSICVNPENTNEIYLLTGDGDGAHGYCTGVLKSSDGGMSWYQTGFTVSMPNFLDAWKMVMLPDAPETMLVACNRGILKTTDGWKTMDTVFTEPGIQFYDLEIHPENSALIYASGINKIYKSIDSGSTWAVNVELHPGASRTAISICTSQPNIIYALSGVSATVAGVIYKTFDGGVTWDTIATNMDILDGGDGDGGRRGQIGYDHTLLVNPDNPEQIWVGAIDLWRSDNSGIDWSHESDWNNYLAFDTKTHPDFHDLVYYNGDVYLAQDGGVARRYEDFLGLHFEEMYTGLNITQYYFFALDPTAEGTQNLAGAQDNGIMKWDGDENYQNVWNGDGGDIAIDFTENDTYYFTATRGLLKNSCDICVPGGINFGSGCGCPDAASAANWTTTPIVIDPDNNNHVITGNLCAHESYNAGASWGQIHELPCTTFYGYTFGQEFDWAYGANYLYRMDSDYVFQPITGVTIDSIVGLITGIAVSSLNDNHAYISLYGYSAGKKVYETTDGGQTWTNISGTLPNVPVHCIIFDKIAGEGVYIGTDIGVFYRDSITVDWVPFRNGMPSVQVTDLEIRLHDSKLYASTFGRGLWRSNRAEECANVVTIPEAFPGYQQFESGAYLSSSAAYNAGFGQEAYYTAAEEITLTEGFEVINNSLFNGEIGNCTFTQFFPPAKTGYLVPRPQYDAESDDISVNSNWNVTVYPNPFDVQASVIIDLPDDMDVTVSLSSIDGKLIKVFMQNKPLTSGKNYFDLNMQNMSSSMYLLHVQAGEQTLVTKLIKR